MSANDVPASGDSPTGPLIRAPLHQPAASLPSFAQRLVLERGVILERAGVDHWHFRSKGAIATADLSTLISELGLRIVRIGFEVAPLLLRDFLAPVTPGQTVLELQVQRLAQDLLLSVETPFVAHVTHLAYIAEATTYHCGQLAAQYLTVLDTVTDGGRKLELFSEDFILSGATSPYFEFEALITAAVRAYDTARFPLWAAYGHGGSPPTNFERVVERVSAPTPLTAILADAVEVYNRAKEYRDCIQHYAHFGARLPFSRIQLLKGKVWSAVALLPDNPKTKSYARFLYANQIDALSYGWQVTDGVIGHLTAVVQALPRKSSTT